MAKKPTEEGSRGGTETRFSAVRFSGGSEVLFARASLMKVMNFKIRRLLALKRKLQREMNPNLEFIKDISGAVVLECSRFN